MSKGDTKEDSLIKYNQEDLIGRKMENKVHGR